MAASQSLGGSDRGEAAGGPGRGLRRALLALSVLGLASCAAPPPLATVEQVDLPRFMGDWFVQAHVPARSERDAYNAVESYVLDARGRVLTTYAFRDGGFDGDVEVMEPVGFVHGASGAEWGMQFLWPFEAEYLIAYLDDAYSETIIARRKRDYAWIMTREPAVPAERLAALVERVVELGYERAAIRAVPQRWPDAGHPLTEARAAAGRPLAAFTRE